MKDMSDNRVKKENYRTDIANSCWFNELMQNGQFYHPLTRARGLDAIPNSDKEVSETYSSRIS